MKKKIMIIFMLALVLLLSACNESSNEVNNKISEETANENKENTGQEVSIEEDGDNTKEEDSNGKKVITDKEGRQVEIPESIERIVVDQWGTGDILVSILAEEAMDKIVAVGRNKTYDIVKDAYAEKYPQIADIADIGGGKGSSIDPEAIIALKPDIFLVANYREEFDDLAMKLDKAGIATVYLNISEEPSTSPQEAIMLTGEILGEEERAKEVKDFIDKQFEIVESKNLDEKEEKPSVYIEKGSGTSEEYDVTWSEGSAWGKIIHNSGGENIVDESMGDSIQIDPEYLISQDPDFIIVAGSTGIGTDYDNCIDTLDQYAARNGWEDMSAIKNNNFVMISHGQERNQFCFFPHLVMAKMFYPDEFGDLEPLEIMEEYFDRFMLLDFDMGHWIVQREV